MNYRDALAWLYSTQRFGIKLGLKNARRLFAALDVAIIPGRVVHVAGTNGKGSVCAMAAAICDAAGYRTGLYTSPHLITFRERIRIGRDLIDEASVARELGSIRELVADWSPHPTFFEITTALALQHFKERECEVVVLETGMGGRLDATNVITPAVSVITPIDLDHQAWLGDTIEKIAGEKAGIIKPRVPVVSSPQRADAAEVLRARAAECDSPIEFVPPPKTPLRVALAGAHQQINAAVALAALGAARIDVHGDAVERGLQAVEWPARFQRFSESIIIDGAHNPAGARALVSAWTDAFGETRAVVIAGMLGDKDATEFWREVTSIASRILLPRFTSQRAVPPDRLRETIANIAPPFPIRECSSIAEALELARAESAPTLITGSLHFAGEVLAVLRGESGDFEVCAQ